MKYILDTHCHTIASGHAYSTVFEMAKEANNKGLELIGITDHGPAMPGGPHMFHIANQRVIPDSICGVEILKGVEANIMNDRGEVDLPEKILKNLDIVIASLHDVCIDPGDRDYNTRALMKALENPYVDIIGHPGNPVFPIDNEAVVLKAKETGKLIEINNSSFLGSRKGSLQNCIEIAKLCKKHQVRIVMGSDAHISYHVGRFDKAIQILNDIEMPEELVMNISSQRLKDYLKSRGKKRFMDESEQPVV